MKVIFFSSEPGGAEVLKSLAFEVRDCFDLYFIATRFGSDRLRLSKFAHIEIENSIEAFIEECRKISPSYVITSATSIVVNNPLESQVWAYCENKRIPTCAFLDQWQNYILRFSSNGKKIDHLPKKIAVMDEIAVNEMVEIGFNPDRLIILGNPYLESSVAQIKAARFEKKTKSSEQKVIGFISEPIAEIYKKSRGYDEFDSFNIFVKMMNIHKDRPYGAILTIKIHPKETQIGRFTEVLDSTGFKYIIQQNEVSAEEFLCNVDEVYGMSSVMLIQAYLAGIPCASIQPNLRGPDPLILTRLNLIPLIDEKNCAEVESVLAKQGKKELGTRFYREKFLTLLSKG